MTLNKKIFIPMVLTLSLSSCGGSSPSPSPTPETTFTVTFNSNGGSTVSSQNIKSGEKATRPSDPIKNGYNFINWYQDTSLINVYDFDTSVTSNITLYAKWSDPIIYNITYYLNGGTNDKDNPITYTIEDSFIFKFATHSEATFDKWTDESGNTITHIEVGTYGDITLFANWKNWKEYQVNVYTNDEDKGTAQGGGTYIYGSDVTITASPLDDYVFNGWYSDSEYKTLLTKNNIYKFTLSSGDVSFYAKFWTKEEDDEWNKNHGVIPAISEDGNYLTYGLYPQSHVNDTSLIAELENIAPETDEEYFYYDNEYYVKDTGNPYKSDYSYLDGTKVVGGTTYYFKCEPITWNIVSSGDNYIIDCFNILYAHRFDDDSNIYKDSELRAWLNNDFYNKAFSIKTTSSYIVPTDLSDVDVMGDKVWAGSKSQYDGNWYLSNSARQKKLSDFAICNYAYMSTSQDYNRNGIYWTRSPHSNNSSYAWSVFTDGKLYSNFVRSSIGGASPALTIKI